MKKTAVILLLLIYSAATMGVTIHLHYCMDEYVGWSLWHAEKGNKCGKCGMKEKKGGCCKDEHKQIKLKAEYPKIAAAKYIPFFNETAALPPIADFPFVATSTAFELPLFNGPPPIPPKRLYVLHCVFLI